jgi:hypothetical protein
MDASQTPCAGADVTIEAASPESTASRELARGILLGEHVVMVPDPPVELLRTSKALIAAITCVPANGSPPEAIPVADVTRLRLRGADLDSACVMLGLAESAQCPQAGTSPSIPQLVEALRSYQGNLWEVMSSFGRTSLAGQRSGGRAAAAVNEEDGPWDHETNSPEEFFIGICNVCRCCHR